jgi:hypothetical protein
MVVRSSPKMMQMKWNWNKRRFSTQMQTKLSVYKDVASLLKEVDIHGDLNFASSYDRLLLDCGGACLDQHPIS